MDSISVLVDGINPRRQMVAGKVLPGHSIYGHHGFDFSSGWRNKSTEANGRRESDSWTLYGHQMDSISALVGGINPWRLMALGK